MLAKLRRSNLSIAALVAEGILSRFSFGALNLALPLYARHLGLSLAEAGILLSINTAVALALKPIGGRIIDRFGKKNSFAVAICFRSLVPVLYSLVGVPWMLYGTAGVHGVSKSVRDPSVDSLIVEHSRNNTIGSNFAWYSTAKSVAGSVGKGAAGVFLTLTASDFVVLFILAGLVSVSSLLAVLSFVREVGSRNSSRLTAEVTAEPATRDDSVNARGDKPKVLLSLLPFLGFGCFISGVIQMFDVLFPILAVEYAGMTEAEVGILFMVATGIVLLAGPAWGWLSDRVSKAAVLLAPGVSSGLASVLYLLFPFSFGVVTGRITDDVGKAAFRPAWGSMMGHVSTQYPEQRGLAVGYMGMGKDAGEIAGPVIASVIWTFWGVPVLMGVRIALAIGAEVYSIAMLSRIIRTDKDARVYRGPAPSADSPEAQARGMETV